MKRGNRLPKWALMVAVALAAPVVTTAMESEEMQSLEDHLRAVRGDIQERRESALRTLIQVDGAQAKEFWALKAQYDEEFQKLADARKAVLREYAKVYKTITTEQAKDLAARSLKFDEDRVALRRKYFDLMSKRVSPLIAGQFLQIQRQFETMADLKVASVVPLAGS